MCQGTALQAAEKLAVLKGHDFSRAVSAAKSMGPLGPEGCFWGVSHGNSRVPHPFPRFLRKGWESNITVFLPN
jgi:hypothetical protein